jgi:hypothetical protein
MAEKRHGVPIPPIPTIYSLKPVPNFPTPDTIPRILRRRVLWEDNPMHRTLQQPICPVREQVADIQQHRGQQMTASTAFGVIAGRDDGDGRPCLRCGVLLRGGGLQGRRLSQDLEAGLGWALEEKGYGTY